MSALRAADAQEASRQARRAAEDRKEQEQAKHTLTIMAVIAAGLMAADVVRILHAAQAGTTVGIISATVLEVAIPFIVSIVVFNTYEAVKQGQSVVMASLATAVAMVIALKLFGLVVRPMFAIFKGVPYSGTVQYGIMFLFVYISLMVALERVARTRLDYSDTIIRAISIPTFILLIVTTIGLALIMPGPKKDDADEEDDATVTEETKSGDTEEAPPETETKDSDSDSGE
jgi:hypothetical protein